ncbi:hypothetical protein BDF21DRAFT_434041 [Thamnidium elegans]|nr:hypothetical protein BDF21DRAFT_434041 [Thamnidium elegans]
MTTLGAFGFTPKRKGGKLAVSSKVIGTEPLAAFIQPTDIIQSKKTIKNYFQPKKQEKEEKEVPIVIRKKISLLNIWHQVEQDSIIDAFKETFSNKRRRISSEKNDYVKRQRTLEQDLSYAIRYLNIRNNNHNSNVRYKMNRQQSNRFISNMTQEFLQ